MGCQYQNSGCAVLARATCMQAQTVYVSLVDGTSLQLRQALSNAGDSCFRGVQTLLILHSLT